MRSWFKSCGRWVGAVLFLALLAVAAWMYRSAVHPEFGRYHSYFMTESFQKSLATQTPARKWMRAVRERLKLSVPQPQSKNGYDWGLKVGPAELGWSIAMNTPPKPDGYIYMRNVNPNGQNEGLWEFALSPKTSLSQVTREDLPEDYYGMDDPRGSQVFGPAWTGPAIKVPEGQVFFARLATNRTTVYIVHLRKQGGTREWGTMEIDYLVVE